MNGKWDAFNVPSLGGWLCNALISLMASYDDTTLEHIPPVLQRGEKEHVLVV